MYDPNFYFWMGVIAWCLIFGTITAAIAQTKNLRVGEWFVLGMLWGIIGVIIVIWKRPALPKAPPGWRAVKCPTCNAVQNIPGTQPRFVCWQCNGAFRLPGMAPQSTPSAPDAPQELASAKSTKVKCPTCQRVQAVPQSQQAFVCEQCGTKLKRRSSGFTVHSGLGRGDDIAWPAHLLRPAGHGSV
jgi:ribosomal protein S27E